MPFDPRAEFKKANLIPSDTQRSGVEEGAGQKPQPKSLETKEPSEDAESSRP